MISNNNKNGWSYKHYYRTSDTFNEFEDIVRCRECGKSIIGVCNLRTGKVTTYEIDNYHNQRLEHEHAADVVTKTDLMHRTAVEIRYVHAPNRDDYQYLLMIKGEYLIDYYNRTRDRRVQGAEEEGVP